MAAMASSWALSKHVSSWSEEDDSEEELERSPFLKGRAFMSEGFRGNSNITCGSALGEEFCQPGACVLGLLRCPLPRRKAQLELVPWMSKLSASEDACLRAVTKPAFVRAAVWSFVSS